MIRKMTNVERVGKISELQELNLLQQESRNKCGPRKAIAFRRYKHPLLGSLFLLNFCKLSAYMKFVIYNVHHGMAY